MSVHSEFSVRVYYEDTDFSGNVYHAAYLKFYERARTEWLRAIGVSHTELGQEGRAFAVREMQIGFLAPAHIDDALTVTTRLAGGSGARIKLAQEIWRADTKLNSALVTVASIKTGGGAARMPEKVRQLIAGLESNN